MCTPALKELRHDLKFRLNFSISSFHNPSQSSPSLAILVPLWFIIISLMSSYLYKVLFSGFQQFKGNFVDGQNNSKHRDAALVLKVFFCTFVYLSGDKMGTYMI